MKIHEALREIAVPIDSVIPDRRNARVHPARNLKTLRDSLQCYGQRKPIVVRRADNRIIAGNGLWKAAKDLGWKQIAAVFVDDDEITATGYALMDNQSALLSEWDFDRLGELVAELNSANFDLSLTGFDSEELTRFITTGESAPVIDAEPQIDQAEELREKWGVEYGDLWGLGQHRLLCGDSTKREDVERCLDGAKPGLMVTDPPYGINYDPAWRKRAAEKKSRSRARYRLGKVANDDRADWREAWQLFPGDVVYSWSPAGAESIIHGQALQAAGFIIRAVIIWAKTRVVISRGDYHFQHEPCWYAVRKGRPSRRTRDRTQTTLWEIPGDKSVAGGHSTQKPLECMARPIRNHDFSEVYDPFVGSGTTIIAAENLHRKCYAIEIVPAYVAICIQRYKDATGSDPQLLERW